MVYRDSGIFRLRQSNAVSFVSRMPWFLSAECRVRQSNAVPLSAECRASVSRMPYPCQPNAVSGGPFTPQNSVSRMPCFFIVFVRLKPWSGLALRPF